MKPGRLLVLAVVLVIGLHVLGRIEERAPANRRRNTVERELARAGG